MDRTFHVSFDLYYWSICAKKSACHSEADGLQDGVYIIHVFFARNQKLLAKHGTVLRREDFRCAGEDLPDPALLKWHLNSACRLEYGGSRQVWRSAMTCNSPDYHLFVLAIGPRWR